MLATSVSVWMSITGAFWSVRKMVVGPPIDAAMSANPPGATSGSPELPRLCTKYPSNACTSGSTPL